MTAPRLSGVQKQVLALYREALRRCAALPPPSRAAALSFTRAEFREGLAVDRLDFQRIEHLLRAGKKKLASLAQSEAFSVAPSARQ
jgi:succinate dehydrogenase assembly factor 1